MQRDGGPGGAGGAGNPTGGSFTGTATALELVGNRCYLYSGKSDVSASGVTFMDFKTGNFYSVVDIQFWTEDVSTDDWTIIINMNGIRIVGQRLASTSAELTGFVPIRIVIPAYTEFTQEIYRASGSGSVGWASTLTGRIYRR